jgi:predicted nucleic acid-binding protein
MLCVESAASLALRAELAAGAERNLWLCAPDLWRYELTSIITKAVHFQQLSETLAQETLQLANHLNVQLFQPDNELVLEAFQWTRRLKRAAAYDSFYLALARRLDCELWTTLLKRTRHDGRCGRRLPPAPACGMMQRICQRIAGGGSELSLLRPAL